MFNDDPLGDCSDCLPCSGTSLEDSLEDFAQSTPSSDSELDFLLSESMELKQKQEQMKIARKALAHGHLDPTIRRELETTVRNWEMKREWEAVADVVIYNTQVCSYCDARHNHYEGIFQRQQNRHKTDLYRWVKATQTMNTGLKKEVKYSLETVPMCSHCMGRFGYES